MYPPRCDQPEAARKQSTPVDPQECQLLTYLDDNSAPVTSRVMVFSIPFWESAWREGDVDKLCSASPSLSPSPLSKVCSNRCESDCGQALSWVWCYIYPHTPRFNGEWSWGVFSVYRLGLGWGWGGRRCGMVWAVVWGVVAVAGVCDVFTIQIGP